MDYPVTKSIKRQIILNIIYILIVLGLTALAFYFTLRGKAHEVGEILSSASWGYIVAILGVVLGCILSRSIAIYSLTRIYDKKYLFHRAIAIDQIGLLYRLVTPAGVGSHFVQAYVYNKQGIRVSNALSVLAMYTIVYQIVLILYGLLSIIIKHQIISSIGSISFSGGSISIWLLIGIGFGFNILTIGFVYLLSFWEPFFKFIRGPIYLLLSKLHLIRDLEASRCRLDESKVNFRNNLKSLLKHVKTLIIVALMFFIYITIQYSVPYICGLAVGNTSVTANYWDSVLLSNIHQMATCVIPIPGSAGIAELVFYNLFYKSNFYSSEDITRASLLLWRTLMFVIPLMIAMIYTIIYRPRKSVNYEDNQSQNIEVQG